MEWLHALIPVALVVLVCGGLHVLMMRGMHRGHDTASGHGGHLSVTDPNDRGPKLERLVEPGVRRAQRPDDPNGDRLAQLERRAAALQQEIEAMLGDPQKMGNGSYLGRVATLHHDDDASQNESEGDAAG
ncbi:MAG: hypothetical protein Q8Q00_03175 [Dehalococcoidia bacterium]|nr:hypothetical protein [Dehalococcoidia bacterium]